LSNGSGLETIFPIEESLSHSPRSSAKNSSFLYIPAEITADFKNNAEE
jgi:hypothetical protein